MPVVSNTSPLLNLAIIGRLSLVRAQFSEVLIPPAVARELRADEGLPGSDSLSQALAAGWLKVTPLDTHRVSHILWRTLDEGEAEAIALALQVQAEHILLDERDGRRSARAAGLHSVGVLGILLRAKLEGALDSLADEIERLRTEANFRIAHDLERALLVEAGEGES